MRTSGDTSGGGALIAVGLLLPAAVILELIRRGDTDGDNPAESIGYLHEHGNFYALSGVCFMLAAFALIAAATHLRLRSQFTMAVGAAAGAMFLFLGALRMSSPGPIDYIWDLDHQWGESAYLVVQMAGTQGALPAGMVATAVWAAAISMAGGRTRSLPRPTVILGFVPLLYPVASVLGIFVGETDSSAAWFAAIVSIFLGVPLWCLAAGTAVILRGRRARADVGDDDVGDDAVPGPHAAPSA